MSDSLRPHGLQHTRLPCPSPTPRACSNSCPWSQWCHPIIYILFCTLLLLPSIFPSFRVFSNESVLASGDQRIAVSASASVLSMNIKDWFPLGSTDLISLLPKDSQESFSIPQYKSISTSVLSLLYSSSLTSKHDSWENHSFDYVDLCQKSDVSAF